MVSLSKGFQECRTYLRGVRGYSDATLINYERTWGQYLGYLREQGHADEARHFTVETVMGFCDWLASKGAVPNTILNKIHGLSTLARFLMKRTDGRGRPVLASNPTLGFERPRQNQVETKFLLPNELVLLLAAPASAGLALARAMMLDTGIRCLEACQANVGDLRQIGETWYIALAVKGRRQAGAERATIPISGACAELLTSRRTMATPDEPLFVDDRGRRFTRSQLTQSMIRLGKRAGITRITSSPHRLRHTANVVARQSGVDALTRASMLNHRSLRTLARYDHLVPGEVVKGREQQRTGLEKYLAQATDGESPWGESPLGIHPALHPLRGELRDAIASHPRIGHP
jgi:site-specific recombinase XerD